MNDHPSTDRIAVVYALRGIAAVWVLASTIVRTAWPTHSFRGYDAFVGIYPLAIFAVLSGVVLGLGVTGSGAPQMPDLKYYAAKRLLRFVPIVWASVLVTIALSALWLDGVTGTPWDATLPLTASATVVQMLFLPGLIVNSGPNPGVGGIALLVQCSIAFPALVWLWQRVSAVALSIVGVALALVPEFFDIGRIAPTFLAVGLFTVGLGVAGLLTEPGIIAMARRAAPWWVAAAVSTLAVLVAFLRAGSQSLFDHHALVSLGIAVATAAMVMHVMDNEFSTAWRLTNFYPLRAVGVMSLSMCLASGPVVQILWKLFCSDGRLSSFIVAIILTLGSPFVFATAIEMAHWFERPCLDGPDRQDFFAQLRLIDRNAPARVDVSEPGDITAFTAAPSPLTSSAPPTSPSGSTAPATPTTAKGPTSARFPLLTPLPDVPVIDLREPARVNAGRSVSMPVAVPVPVRMSATVPLSVPVSVGWELRPPLPPPDPHALLT